MVKMQHFMLYVFATIIFKNVVRDRNQTRSYQGLVGKGELFF